VKMKKKKEKRLDKIGEKEGGGWKRIRKKIK
jgi:hypothetical protein